MQLDFTGDKPIGRKTPRVYKHTTILLDLAEDYSIEVSEPIDKVTELMEQSKNGEIITLTSTYNDIPIHLLGDHIVYFKKC